MDTARIHLFGDMPSYSLYTEQIEVKLSGWRMWERRGSVCCHMFIFEDMNDLSVSVMFPASKVCSFHVY